MIRHNYSVILTFSAASPVVGAMGDGPALPCGQSPGQRPQPGEALLVPFVKMRSAVITNDFPNPFDPFRCVRMVVQEALEKAGVSSAVDGFDAEEAAGQFPAKAQVAGVGVGLVFLFPAAEAGNEEHRDLEDKVEDIVLEADEEGKEVDDDAQKRNPDEKAADEEDGVVHHDDDLAEPFHAYAEEVCPGMAVPDMSHFMGHDADDLSLRKLPEQGGKDHDALSQGKGVVFIPHTHVKMVVRGIQVSPAADFMEPLFQERRIFPIGSSAALGEDENPFKGADLCQNAGNEHGGQGKLHQQVKVIPAAGGGQAAHVGQGQHDGPEGKVHDEVYDKGKDDEDNGGKGHRSSFRERAG